MSQGPPQIFDLHARALRRARARRRAAESFLIREAAESLSERLRAVRRTFSNGLQFEVGRPELESLNPRAKMWTSGVLQENETLSVSEASADLVVSILSLQSVNDLPGVLVQARRTLQPDGIFLAALFGGETLFELRDAMTAGEIATHGGISPRVSPFGEVRQLGALLQRAGFSLPVADVERTVVRYGAFSTLVSDLRAIGETNALSQRRRAPLSRATLRAAISHYQSHHADSEGRLRATFDIVYLTGWAPHDSQQRALRPGTAKTRLADALKTTERSAGERVPKR